MPFSIRPLIERDVSEYKAIRLLALQTDPSVFRSSYKDEAGLPEAEWVKRITNPDRTIFGLFHDAALIGITAISIQSEGHGYMTHSYIHKEFRKQNLSKFFFDIRIAWAKERGLKKLLINHRKSNLVSKAAILRSGFKYTGYETVEWPDGKYDDLLHYELLL